VDRRKQILSAVRQFGGKYIKDLDRSCTHLIIAKPASESKSSEKVKFVLNDIRERDLSRRRGKKVQGHDIRICYEEWIWDCVGFNGRFKEDDYDARKPRNGGKVKAEDVINGTIFLEDGDAPKKEVAVKEEEGPAVLRKRKREDIDSLVGDLISTTVAKMEIGDAQTPTRPSGRGTASNELRKASLLHATRTASFGPVKSNDGPTPSMPATAPQPLTGEIPDGKSAIQIFAGLRIGHLIDEAYEGLERALAAHGGTFVTEEQRLQGQPVDYVVVRL
jgi:DNA replication regulator DPB11